MPAENEASAELSRSITRSFALHVACRLAEALALGWLAAAILLALTALGSSDARASDVLVAAALVGVLAAGSAWIEQVPSPRDHLRRVDRRMRFGGALVTAFDVADDEQAGPFAPALIAGVGSRLRGTDLARASLPSTPLAVLALILGVAVVFASRDFASRERAANERHAASQVSEGNRVAFADAARLLTQRSNRTPDAATTTLAEMRALAQDLARAASAATLDGARKDDLSRRLSALQAQAALSTPELEVLAAAASALGAVSASSPPASSPNASGKTGAGVDSASAGLASGAPLGKMNGPDQRSADSNSGLVPGLEPSRAEQGVGSIRWWPARHDAVVEAWLASTPRSK